MRYDIFFSYRREIYRGIELWGSFNDRENIVLVLFNNHIIICLRVIVKKCFMLVWKHASKMTYIYNANSYI